LTRWSLPARPSRTRADRGCSQADDLRPGSPGRIPRSSAASAPEAGTARKLPPALRPHDRRPRSCGGSSIDLHPAAARSGRMKVQRLPDRTPTPAASPGSERAAAMRPDPESKRGFRCAHSSPRPHGAGQPPEGSRGGSQPSPGWLPGRLDTRERPRKLPADGTGTTCRAGREARRGNRVRGGASPSCQPQAPGIPEAERAGAMSRGAG
jgi:hypothetical protein